MRGSILPRRGMKLECDDVKGNEAGACAAPEPRTRAVTALDPHLRLLLASLTELGSRCYLEERESQAWCRFASGPAAKPPARMLCIRGKPGNNPQGKVNFPPGIFPAFLGQKPSDFRKPQRGRRRLLVSSNGVISPVAGPGGSSPWWGLG